MLKLIAEGRSYGQIVDGHADIGSLDIFKAAEEALLLNELQSAYKERMEKVKRQYPRAYQRWADKEDARLSAMHEQGRTVAEMAQHLERQPSASRSRLAKLALIPAENERGER